MSDIQTIIYLVGIIIAVIFFGVYLVIIYNEDKKKELKKQLQFNEIKDILNRIEGKINDNI